MSCNGCRVLRKGCSDSCVLRPCLQWIPTPESQGHATVFVAKFFGRAGLMSFISNVPDSQRPALFQSLLYEACGRTVNPVSGAVGLLWTGNWQICQAAVDTVLRGGTLRPSPDFLNGASPQAAVAVKRQTPDEWSPSGTPQAQLLPILAKLEHQAAEDAPAKKLRRAATPSLNSEEESGTTNCFEGDHPGEPRLLNLFL